MARARGPKYRVPFRRRREGKTDYRKRLALVKSGKTRMVFRRSNRGVVVQFVDFDPKGDITRLTVTSKHLTKMGWPSKRNKWTAYLVGFVAGKRAKEKGISEFVFDMGLYKASKGCIAFAALKGALDAGLHTNYDKSVLPDVEPPAELKEKFESVIKGE